MQSAVKVASCLPQLCPQDGSPTAVSLCVWSLERSCERITCFALPSLFTGEHHGWGDPQKLSRRDLGHQQWRCGSEPWFSVPEGKGPCRVEWQTQWVRCDTAKMCSGRSGVVFAGLVFCPHATIFVGHWEKKTSTSGWWLSMASNYGLDRKQCLCFWLGSYYIIFCACLSYLIWKATAG